MLDSLVYVSCIVFIRGKNVQQNHETLEKKPHRNVLVPYSFIDVQMREFNHREDIILPTIPEEHCQKIKLVFLESIWIGFCCEPLSHLFIYLLFTRLHFQNW